MARPWQSRQEMLTDQALQAAISDPETIRATRPSVPQVLFPERFGIQRQELGVIDVLNLSRQGVSYRSWVSGMPVMKHELMGGEFEGSGRYSMNSLGNL